MGVCNWSIVRCTLLYVHSSFAIILMGKRELVALLSLSSWCLVIVVGLFLQFVIVVFPDHTHLLFLLKFFSMLAKNRKWCHDLKMPMVKLYHDYRIPEMLPMIRFLTFNVYMSIMLFSYDMAYSIITGLAGYRNPQLKELINYTDLSLMAMASLRNQIYTVIISRNGNESKLEQSLRDRILAPTGC